MEDHGFPRIEHCSYQCHFSIGYCSRALRKCRALVLYCFLDNCYGHECFQWNVPGGVLKNIKYSYQNSMFGLAADFPGRFINALVFGNNICGTFTSVLAIVTTLGRKSLVICQHYYSAFNSTKTVALLYFSISLAVVVLCLVSIIFITQFVSAQFVVKNMLIEDLYKYYATLGEKRRKAENSVRPSNCRDIWDMIVNQYWATIKIVSRHNI